MQGAELWSLNPPLLVWLCFCLDRSSLAASTSILFPSTGPLWQHQHRAVMLGKGNHHSHSHLSTHWKRPGIVGFEAEASAQEFTGISAVQSRSKMEQCELGGGVVNQGTNKQWRMWQGKWRVYGEFRGGREDVTWLNSHLGLTFLCCGGCYIWLGSWSDLLIRSILSPL